MNKSNTHSSVKKIHRLSELTGIDRYSCRVKHDNLKSLKLKKKIILQYGSQSAMFRTAESDGVDNGM